MGSRQGLLLLLALLPAYLSAQNTIRLTNGEWPPYLSEQLPHFGFASHLVTEAFSAVNIEVVYEFFPWKRAYKYALNGKSTQNQVWHGTLVWVYTDERAKEFFYTNEVITDTEVLFYLKSNPLQWESIDDLRGKTIGATLHTVYPLFETAQELGLLRIERTGNYDVLFKRLLYGRVDAVPQVKNVANYYIRTSLTPLEQNRITYSPTVIQERKYHVILTKKNKDNERFQRLFNEGLKRIKANGTYDKLLQDLHDGKYDAPAIDAFRTSTHPTMNSPVQQ